MTNPEFLCLRCGQGKYTCHTDTTPHPSTPAAAECEGFANVHAAGVYSYDPGLSAAEGGFEGGGGSSGGGGASGTW